MKRFRMLTIFILAIVAVLFYVQPVLAFPPMPSSFWGTVKVDGANVSFGTIVSAKINGVQYASTTVINYQGEPYYSLDIPGDDPDTSGIVEGGVEGNTILFYIDSIKATQTAPWHSGSIISLNLTGYTGVNAHLIYLPLVIR